MMERTSTRAYVSLLTRSKRQRRFVGLTGALALALAVLGAGLTSSSSFAQSNLTWGSAIEVPGSASLNVGGNGYVFAISCASAGDCSAVGSYTDGSNNLQGFVVSESSGTWGSAIEIPGLGSLSGGSNADPESISCPSVGNCSVGGYYRDSSGAHQAFVVGETNGTWDSAEEVPGTATLNVGGSANAYTISCSSAGNCGAGGSYSDSSGAHQAFVDGETNGTWGSAEEVPGTATLNVGGSANVYMISCSTSGNCSAGGPYNDGSSHYQGYVVSETNGTWGDAIEIPGLGSLNSAGNAYLYTISCSSAGNCGAGGSYKDGSNYNQAYVASESNGTWGNAIEVPGTATLNANGDAELFSISCPSAGNCSAGGYYSDSANKYQAYVVSETSGTWAIATEVPGTATLNAGGDAYANSVSCSSVGNCGAGGTYKDGSNNYQAYVVNESNGTWGSATEVPGTATLNTGGNAYINSISCTADGSCSAGGAFTDGANKFQAMVDDLTVTTSTTTTSTTTTSTTTTTTTSTTLPRKSVPGAPHIHAASSSKGGISISVVGITKNGGSPISKYQYSLNSKSWVNVMKNSHGVFVILHLISHKTYGARLRAINSVGAGAPSNAVKVTVK